MLLFTLLVASLVAVAFSLTPLSCAMRFSGDQRLKSSGPMISQNRQRLRSGNAAIAFQIAMCFTLLVAAGLTVRTLINYENVDLGMSADHLLVFDVDPQGLSSGVPSWSFYNRLLDRVKAVPGVEAVSLAQWRPGSGWLRSGGIRLDATTLRSDSGTHTEIYSNAVGPNFFHSMGIPVLEGRDITSADTPGIPPVVIVNQTLADGFLKDGALGHRIDGAEIVGVVRNSKFKSVRDHGMPTVYYALSQMGMSGQISVKMRTGLNPIALLPEIRSTIHGLDPNLPLQNPMTQAAQFEKSYVTPMLFARLALGFGVLAVILVATGLYGTLAYRPAAAAWRNWGTDGTRCAPR